MTAPSLRRRALLAVALTVCFYVLAVGVALALIAAPILLFVLADAGNVWLALAMIGAGLGILRAIVPERDRFEPPGPLLDRASQPRLHALLDEVAESVSEPPAEAVHLDLAVNAAVLEHRGKRVMLLGLPLLATLDEDELRAVVAHEYGHYIGGDTRFSAWIWRTRAAVIKTASTLAQSDSWFRRNVVRWPFHGYALLFLRITNALSRRAEFAADAVSARVASAEATGRALRRLEAVAPAFDGYWAADVVPMLEAERRPPIAAGFNAMTSHRELAATLDDIVRSDLETSEPDPYASHPTLRERLTALGVPVVADAPEPAERPALALLDDVPGLERALLVMRFGDEVGELAPGDWDVAADAHLRRLRATVERFGSAFPADLTVEGAGDAAARPSAFHGGLHALLGVDAPSDPELDRVVLETLASAVTCTAVDAGVELTAVPGEPLRLRRDGHVLDPWEPLGKIAAGESDPAAWRADPIVATIADRPLVGDQPARSLSA